MKLHDLKNLDKDDVLGLLGLETKHSAAGQLLAAVGTFGVGLLVGAGVALLLAPKPGRELREQLRARMRTEKPGAEAVNGAASEDPSRVV
jgi:hypothetical protein